MGSQQKTKIISWNNQKKVHYDNELDVINKKLAELQVSSSFQKISLPIQRPTERINPFREVKTSEEKYPAKVVQISEEIKPKIIPLKEMPIPQEIFVEKKDNEVKIEHKMLLHQLSNAANELQDVLEDQFGMSSEPQKKSFLRKIFSRKN